MKLVHRLIWEIHQNAERQCLNLVHCLRRQWNNTYAISYQIIFNLTLTFLSTSPYIVIQFGFRPILRLSIFIIKQNCVLSVCTRCLELNFFCLGHGIRITCGCYSVMSIPTFVLKFELKIAEQWKSTSDYSSKIS